ncbi:MAG: hypothetical protein HYT97_09355 [Elusimicrobia bacterium]|nr:hypothetical protein [Elusimicrobiota bacterium]
MKKVKKYFAAVVFIGYLSFYSFNQLSAQNLGISAKTKGTIRGSIQIENAKGDLTLTLLTISWDKIYEKPVKVTDKEFVFSGCKANESYVVQVEGDISIEDTTGTVNKHYSRAAKVTTDEKGSALVIFGN